MSRRYSSKSCPRLSTLDSLLHQVFAFATRHGIFVILAFAAIFNDKPAQ